MKKKRINAAFDAEQEEAIQQSIRDEAVRIRRQAYYRANRERILAQATQWRIDRKTQVPKKYAHMSLEECNAMYRARRNGYKRKRVADMTVAEAEAYRDRKAEEARQRRADKTEEVRRYQREYHRMYRQKNRTKKNEATQKPQAQAKTQTKASADKKK